MPPGFEPMRWNSVKKTAQWAVFRNSPEGFSLRGRGARSAARNPGGPAIVLNAVLRTAFNIAAAKPSCTPYCLSAFGLRTEVRGASASRQYGAPGGFSLSGVRMWHLGNSPAQPFQKKFSKSWEMFWTARGGSCNISTRVTCAMRRCGSVGRAAHS